MDQRHVNLPEGSLINYSGLEGFFLSHGTAIGFVAGTLTTISFLPQVYYVYRSKRTTDISLSMYLLFFFGVLMWLVYGVILGSIPIIFFNAITLVLAGAVLAGKFLYPS